MSDVTQILSAIEAGDPQAAERLLPLVYDELRQLAAAKLAREKHGQTLDATALVHEAYLRLAPSSAHRDHEKGEVRWNSRGHFFGDTTLSRRSSPPQPTCLMEVRLVVQASRLLWE